MKIDTKFKAVNLANVEYNSLINAEVSAEIFEPEGSSLLFKLRKEPVTFEGNITFVNRKFFSKTSNNYKKLHNEHLIRQQAYNKAYKNKQK